MTTLTITHAPTGYTYAGTEYASLWAAAQAAMVEVYGKRPDLDVDWLHGRLKARRRAWINGTKVEVRDV